MRITESLKQKKRSNFTINIAKFTALYYSEYAIELIKCVYYERLRFVYWEATT